MSNLFTPFERLSSQSLHDAGVYVFGKPRLYEYARVRFVVSKTRYRHHMDRHRIVWDLLDSDNYSDSHRIVLSSTINDVEDMHEIIDLLNHDTNGYGDFSDFLDLI